MIHPPRHPCHLNGRQLPCPFQPRSPSDGFLLPCKGTKSAASSLGLARAATWLPAPKVPSPRQCPDNSSLRISKGAAPFSAVRRAFPRPGEQLPPLPPCR